MRPGLAYLPPPGQCSVEGRITGELEPGLPYVGFVDMRERPGEAPWIGDHKTSGNPERYGKTANTLHDCVQFNLYAGHVMRETGAPRLPARWVYYATKGRPRAYPVDVVAERQRVGDVIGETIIPTARLLAKLRREQPSPLDLPPTPEACDMYGGCDYRSKCGPIKPRWF